MRTLLAAIALCAAVAVAPANAALSDMPNLPPERSADLAEIAAKAMTADERVRPVASGEMLPMECRGYYLRRTQTPQAHARLSHCE